MLVISYFCYGRVLEPLQFVNSLDAKKHILMLRNDPVFGKIIAFRFLENGLMKGESGLYLTNEDPQRVIDGMMKSDTDMQVYVKNKSLKILQLPKFDEDPDGILLGIEKFIQKTLSELKPPYRIVGRIISDISTELGMSVELALERYVHARFDSIDGSILCTYDYNEIPKKDRLQWMDKLIKTHHAVIYANSPQKARAALLL